MQKALKIILKEKEFEIPLDFRYFNDIHPDIRQILLKDKQYIVKSNVQEETLKSFINFWINKVIPEFTSSNLSEYDQLSQEFDLMKEVLSIYKRFLQQIQEKEKENQQLNSLIESNTINYNEIINILFKKLPSSPLKNKLLAAIQEENIEKIKFYTQDILVDEDLVYIINEDSRTAGVISCQSQKRIINIPVIFNFSFLSVFEITVIHEEAFKNVKSIQKITFSSNSILNEIQNEAFYSSSIQSIVIPKSVKKIGDSVFAYCDNLKTVDFEENSELSYIGVSAFEGSHISTLSLPSNNIEFKENWCFWTHLLNNLLVSPSKQNCICLNDDGFLLMKSDPKSDVFDILLLAPRDVKKAVIPPFVKKIAQLAFACCNQLTEVECSRDSELKIIGSKAFNGSSIKKLIIPSTVEVLEEEWCNEADSLSNIIILPCEKENIMCYQDEFIFGKLDINTDIFDILYFASRDIQSATIPSFIRIIGSNAFDGCKLQTIHFSDDSELVSIGKYAFQNSKLTSISIPYRVTKIEMCTFVECHALKHIDMPVNSELREFGESSLYWSSIKSLFIPSKVEKLKLDWCDNTAYLTDISVSPNNKYFMCLDNKFIIGKSDQSSSVYDILVLVRRDIQAPIIPSFIKRIGSCAFNFCDQLETVIFTEDSNLEVISENAFSCSSIKRIKFPSKLKEIEYRAFDECSDLKIVEFEENCQLNTIGCSAFHSVPITSFIFPSHLRKIGDLAFDWTELNIIEIQENSVVKSISSSIFPAKYPDFIMIPVKIRKEFNFVDLI